MKNLVKINVHEDVRRGLLKCISLGTSDDYRERMKDLITSNSKHSMKWDCLNERLQSASDGLGCTWGISEVSKGLWSVISIYHKESRILFHFVRKNRLQTLLEQWRKGGGRFHYLYSLIQTLNNGLAALEEQVSLFDHLDDVPDVEKRTSKSVSILADSSLELGDIQMEAVVSFDEQNGIMRSARLSVYNEKLELVADEDWSEFITPVDSIIADSAEDYSDHTNRPVHGLSISAKGLKRTKNPHLNLEDIIENRLINEIGKKA